MSVMLEAARQIRLVPALQAKGAMIVAGGTLAVAELNYGQGADGTLIILDRLGLDRIAVVGKKATFGAMVTMAEIARDRRLKLLHPVCNSIGGPAQASERIGRDHRRPSPAQGRKSGWRPHCAWRHGFACDPRVQGRSCSRRPFPR